MRRVDWCSEDDPQVGPNEPTFFPARISRRKPVWLSREGAPSTYIGMLDEVYAALHAAILIVARQLELGSLKDIAEIVLL